MTYIDISPTWQGLLPALLAVIENGSAEGRAMARVELSRMAEAADLHNAAVRPEAKPETIDDRYAIYCANVADPVSYDEWLNR